MATRSTHFVVRHAALVVFVLSAIGTARARDWSLEAPTARYMLPTLIEDDPLGSDGQRGRPPFWPGALTWTLEAAPADDHDEDAFEDEPGLEHSTQTPTVAADILPPASGFAYPRDDISVVRGFDADKCWHQGIDVNGTTPYFGIGEPIYSIARAEVTFIGTPTANPARYGRIDRRGGTTKRRGIKLPRTLEVEGYGTVYPFTRSMGQARTGVFVITKSLHPKYPNYLLRYMHLAAVHPKLEVGQILEPGDEIGLMGATGTRESAPHLHLDIETPIGRRVDPAPLIGLGKIAPSHCNGIHKAFEARKRRRRHIVKPGDTLWKIARKHGLTIKQLMRLNRIRNPRRLRLGQKLRLR